MSQGSRIPGFYKRVKKPSAKELAAWKRLPFNEKKYLKNEIGGTALTGEKVFHDLFSLTDEAEMGHIQLSRSADLVVVGLGIDPATHMLQGIELNLDGSVSVDRHMRVAEGLYAAGDVARFPDWRDGLDTRIEHWRLAEQHAYWRPRAARAAA